jgi:hypothetical protein
MDLDRTLMKMEIGTLEIGKIIRFKALASTLMLMDLITNIKDTGAILKSMEKEKSFFKMALYTMVSSSWGRKVAQELMFGQINQNILVNSKMMR